MPDLGPQFHGDCPTCQAAVQRRTSIGVMARGTESHRLQPGVCGRPTAEGSDLCSLHLRKKDEMSTKLAARREWEAKNPGKNWRP
jgi:hypothetical protein